MLLVCSGCKYISYLFLTSPLHRTSGFWGKGVSHGQQDFYLHQHPRLILHGGVWFGQRHYKELADQA